MKYFSGILLASLVAVGNAQAATTRELIPSLLKLQDYVVKQAPIGWDLHEGLVLGLQQNPDNKQHQCYVSFETLKGDVQKMPDYINNIGSGQSSDNSVVTAITNNPWFQPGTYFKLSKRAQELGALFFDLYE